MKAKLKLKKLKIAQLDYVNSIISGQATNGDEPTLFIEETGCVTDPNHTDFCEGTVTITRPTTGQGGMPSIDCNTNDCDPPTLGFDCVMGG